MTGNRPVIHGRDHSHGGTDPAYHAWEDVGSGASGGGGYVFVQEFQSSSGNTITLTLPNNARHIVFYCSFSGGYVSFNGDQTNGHYKTIYSYQQVYNGTITEVNGAGNAANFGIDLGSSIAGATGTAFGTITLPYYRQPGSAGGGSPLHIGYRGLLADFTLRDNNPVSAYDLLRQSRISGSWLPSTDLAPAPITSVTFFAQSGAIFFGSMYKVM